MSRVSIRYAKAVFAAALEEKTLDKVAEDFKSIKSLIEDSKDFYSFLVNPLISSSKRVVIVKDLFAGKVQDLTFNFLQLICEKKRLNQLPEIISRFEKLIMVNKNQVFAEITSVAEIDSTQLNLIKTNLESITSKSVLLSTKNDSRLIGGFKVQVEGVIIDSSVKNQLLKLKEKLIS